MSVQLWNHGLLTLIFALQNPLPYVARFPDADVLTSSDEVVHTVEDDQLEIWDKSKLSLHFIYVL